MNAEHLERMQTDWESESLGPQMSEFTRLIIGAYASENADPGVGGGRHPKVASKVLCGLRLVTTSCLYCNPMLASLQHLPPAVSSLCAHLNL